MSQHKLRRTRGRVGLNAKLDASDCFSTYLYTGNGTIQTINNGIDLAGKGGMVWTKRRDNTSNNRIYDTGRGATHNLITESPNADSVIAESLTSFNSTGFSLGTSTASNVSTATYASWTFRKAPKFFDIVTFTTDVNGNTGSIAHSLGCEVGMVYIKTTSGSQDWKVYHRSLSIPAKRYLQLNTTNSEVNSFDTTWIAVSDTAISFPAPGLVLDGNATYVAYLYAHDTSADGIIQCGSFTTDGSGNATVNLGWEPQYLMEKSSSAVQDWYVHDVIRGLTTTPTNISKTLRPNTSGAEDGYWDGVLGINPTGFTVTGTTASRTFIYMAIRRGNKVPTSGTEVYNAIARTGTGAVATVTGVGFAPDLVFGGNRTYGMSMPWCDRLRGAKQVIASGGTIVEATDSGGLLSFDMSGMSIGNDSGGLWLNVSGRAYINYFFKRAKGFFDIVCYTGTGVARTVNHNLGVVPEMMIVKGRSGTIRWSVYHQAIGNTQHLVLNTVDIPDVYVGYWNNTTPTALDFTVGVGTTGNGSGSTYVAYLFATLAGISKCGSYTGNGTSQTINCGFTTGARFVLCKRTDSTGDWKIMDTVRGITASADPTLALNSVAAEVTTGDCIDPNTVGFDIVQEATNNLNVTSATYIYLAIS